MSVELETFLGEWKDRLGCGHGKLVTDWTHCCCWSSCHQLPDFSVLQHLCSLWGVAPHPNPRTWGLNKEIITFRVGQPRVWHACQAKDMMQLWHVKLLVPDSENDRISKMPQLLLRGSAILKNSEHPPCSTSRCNILRLIVHGLCTNFPPWPIYCRIHPAHLKTQDPVVALEVEE